jgi:hypothetical protein
MKQVHVLTILVSLIQIKVIMNKINKTRIEDILRSTSKSRV